MTEVDLRYPIGRFQPGPVPDAAQRRALLSELAEQPIRMRAAVANLSESQLDTPYRPDGWTIRQVVHHLADAHMHWYVRTKLALTEENPPIMSFDEGLWSGLHDARTEDLAPSLAVLDGVCQRWVSLFRSLTEEQWKRTMVHPQRGTISLEFLLPLQIWHASHHTAHIVHLRNRMGWK
jgi:uncharacterized damage-inducible protein DinB